ncbi:hypothetical protein KSS87_000411 [Heliosperma pusillum]|nr:hypothetical protein KSS87_000411 [Heliosperma pusillum]
MKEEEGMDADKDEDERRATKTIFWAVAVAVAVVEDTQTRIMSTRGLVIQEMDLGPYVVVVCPVFEQLSHKIQQARSITLMEYFLRIIDGSLLS